jgi:hypothetical protein
MSRAMTSSPSAPVLKRYWWKSLLSWQVRSVLKQRYQIISPSDAISGIRFYLLARDRQILISLSRVYSRSDIRYALPGRVKKEAIPFPVHSRQQAIPFFAGKERCASFYYLSILNSSYYYCCILRSSLYPTHSNPPPIPVSTKLTSSYARGTRASLCSVHLRGVWGSHA